MLCSFLIVPNKLVIKSIRLESCRKTSPCLISKLCELRCSKCSRNYIWFQSPDYELMNVSVASCCVHVLPYLEVLCFVSWIDSFYYFKFPERVKNLTKKCSNSKFPCQQQICLKRYISHNCVIKEIKTRMLVWKNNYSPTILILIRNIICLSFISFVFNHLFLSFVRTKNIKKEETFHPSFCSSTLLVLHLFPSWLEINQRIEKENERKDPFLSTIHYSFLHSFIHLFLPFFKQSFIH